VGVYKSIRSLQQFQKVSLHLAIIARVAKDMVEVEGFHNMYDSRLKLQLLYQVMASHFPDEKQPSPDPSHLSAAVSIIRRHELLSEAAVDAWNERVFPRRSWMLAISSLSMQ